MKHALACALLIFVSAVAAPASATDAVMPLPVTDGLPPPPPPDTELPAPAADHPAPPAEQAAPPASCENCPAPRRYDSQEVIKKIQEIDRSRTVNTVEMAPSAAPKRVNSGIRVRSDVTLVNFVVHHYRVIESPGLVPASEVVYRPRRAANCRYGRNRHGACRHHVLRVRD
jgi:hypothetical protein